MHSSGYIIRFVLIITALSALLLTSLHTVWKEQSDVNEAIFNKRGVIQAINNLLPKDVKNMSDTEVLKVFDENITQRVVDLDGDLVESAQVVSSGYKGGKAEDINMAKERKKPAEEQILPLYVYEAGNEKAYILSVRGNGLWDEIWGCIALKDDLNTIVGTAFDHKAETPGLGAEIKDNPQFSKQFQGKKIFGEDGKLRSVVVRKGGAKDPVYEVDAISGSTITSDGVTDMLYDGIKKYEPYLETLK